MTEHRSTDQSFDAVVVGGGVIGLACGWRAAQRGLSVCVLERGELGSGATGVAAGMLAPVGEASWGEERLLELNLASHRLWPAFAEELAEASGREVGYRAIGALHVALDRDEAEQLRRRHGLQQELGVESEWLRPRECRRLEPGLAPTLTAGVHAQHEAASHPQLLAEALAAAMRSAGGRIETEAEVVEADLKDAGSVLRTADGREFHAARVVLASGCWAGQTAWLPSEARPPVRPVKGQILELRARASEPLCERIVASERVYVVPRADGRVIVGATVEERGFDTAVTAGGVHELLREAYRALPDVAELELLDARAGLRPGTPDNGPVLGWGRLDGLLLATGHYRNGVLLAPVTADAVAALLVGEEPPEETAPFAADRFGTPEAVAL